MRSILLATAVLSVIANRALADETLKWRHVQHAASIQTQQVGDVGGHTLSLYRLPGLASFTDGSTGTTMVIGTNDGVNGSGPANGYLILTFSDGSQVWAKYTGEVKVEGNRVPRKGTFTVIGGKGRYVGAKGDGTWQGDGSLVENPDYLAYIDGVLNIKK
jgi:hypothetical protein